MAKESAPTWETLLSSNRLGRDHKQGFSHSTRTDFDRDFDRIVFSSAFRRLKDKTQVFPLSRNDFTRTRLTHSIEVASVGRSLGRMVCDELRASGVLSNDCADLGSIVAAACLAHDIGNPPFGHSGEAAIQHWASNRVRHDAAEGASATKDEFASPIVVGNHQQASDLQNFEGNAQGIRVVTRLQTKRRSGGMQLTLATIGAMMKYPCTSLSGCKGKAASSVDQKKFGFFQDDQSLIISGLRSLGLPEYEDGAFRRHPLAFLVEAADDITNAIVDLEDAVDQGAVEIDTAIALMEPIARHVDGYKDTGYTGTSRLQWLRAYSIDALTAKCVESFVQMERQIVQGEMCEPLIDSTSLLKEYNDVKSEVEKNAYTDRRVLLVEVAGFKVIAGLLEEFTSALLSPDTPSGKKLLQLFPVSYLGVEQPDVSKEDAVKKLSTYQRLLAVTDYVSGMTDSFALNLYQQLSGIRLPE
ncbi:MAG: dNTP triphosphohydrolase [Pirellulales bacterium]|nr:dNTP triphosphohydrolase [Pirellulales bacterium]